MLKYDLNYSVSNDHFNFQTDAFQGLDISRLSTEDIIARSRLLDNEVKVRMRQLDDCMPSNDFGFLQIMKNDIVRISHESQSMRDRIKDNKEKIKVNKTLPYLVSNVIEVNRFQLFILANNAHFQLFDLDPQGEEDEGANIDLDAQRKGKCAVIKTSTRQVRRICFFRRIYQNNF